METTKNTYVAFHTYAFVRETGEEVLPHKVITSEWNAQEVRDELIRQIPNEVKIADVEIRVTPF